MRNRNASGPHERKLEHDIFKTLFATEEVSRYARKQAEAETKLGPYRMGYDANHVWDSKQAKEHQEIYDAAEHKHAMRYIIQGIVGNKYTSQAVLDSVLGRLQNHKDSWSSGNIFHGLKSKHIISVKQLRTASELMKKYDVDFSPTLPPVIIRER